MEALSPASASERDCRRASPRSKLTCPPVKPGTFGSPGVPRPKVDPLFGLVTTYRSLRSVSFWFRDMRPDEALMFRAYDNLPDWRAGVPHSAFDDPSCPPGGPPRVSVEARAFAIYD